MRIAIVRRTPNTSFSMDVYADGLVSGLSTVRPDWEIVELQPQLPIRLHKHLSGRLLEKTSQYYEQYWCYPKRVKACSADIVHVVDHSDAHLAYWLAASPTPTVVTCHDLINFLQPENASHQALLPGVSSALWRYSVKGLKAADHVVAVSDHTAKDVVNLFQLSSEHISVAHNGVENIFAPLPAAVATPLYTQYKIPRDRFYLLNVGSTQPRKNIETVLRSLSKLTRQEKQSTKVHLIKAGAAFTIEQTALIECEGLQPYITHIQNPDKATLVKLYSLANILVAPSLYEGFGITILEAMTSGVPVITSNVSSLPEVAGDAALLIEPTDVDALVSNVRSLQTDPILYASFVQKGLSRAENFTWENSAEKVARVYENLLENRAITGCKN